ncbi:hypothetical protein ACHAWF_011843 [Thalassiosira exigua]
MPQTQGNRQRPQRRVFRGRGGPTDGNIPPPKTVRPRVKYRAEEKKETGGGRGEDFACAGSDRENESACEIGSSEATEPTPLVNESDAMQNDGLLEEIDHLKQRINNVQSSLQTSKLSNPTKWRANCLHPARNVVNEWRSVVKYHNLSSIRSYTKSDGRADSGNDKNADDIGSDAVHSLSLSVFGLIQTSLQTGPLVGSNPGYFKRCGGEVATIALYFLKEIVELAEWKENCDKSLTGASDDRSNQSSCGNQANTMPALDERGERCELVTAVPNEYSDAYSDNESDSTSSGNTLDSNDAELSIKPQSVNMLEINSPTNPHQERMLLNLQCAFLFTEKQSQRFLQWLRNAENASQRNRPPTKAAHKLQSQKSKKQNLKDLKMERKMKKKKKGGK